MLYYSRSCNGSWTFLRFLPYVRDARTKSHEVAVKSESSVGPFESACDALHLFRFRW
jgi:hypothetical protein